MAFLSLSDILCGTLPHFSFYAAITNCAEVHSITDEYHCEFSVRDINTKSVTLIVRSTQEQLLPQINKPGDLIRVTGATLEERFFYTFLKFLMNCLNTVSLPIPTDFYFLNMPPFFLPFRDPQTPVLQRSSSS